MGAVNHLVVETSCGQCGKYVEICVQFRYGAVTNRVYVLGDEIQWGARQNRGRCNLEGLVVQAMSLECSICSGEPFGTCEFAIVIECNRIKDAYPNFRRHDFSKHDCLRI